MRKKLIKILSAKNSIIPNPCSIEHEIVVLRSSHNNITLFDIILFMGLGKCIYLSRMNWFSKNSDIKFTLTFLKKSEECYSNYLEETESLKYNSSYKAA